MSLILKPTVYVGHLIAGRSGQLIGPPLQVDGEVLGPSNVVGLHLIMQFVIVKNHSEDIGSHVVFFTLRLELTFLNSAFSW